MKCNVLRHVAASLVWLWGLSVTFGASFMWDGGGLPDNNLSTASNWLDDVAPNFTAGADSIVFAGGVNTSPNLRLGLTTGDIVSGITFDSSAAAFTIEDSEHAGNFLQVSLGSVTNSSSVAQTFNAPVTLQKSTVVADTAGLTFNGGITIGTSPNVFNANSDITVNGPIGGGSTVVKRGDGRLILNAASTFTGELQIGSATPTDLGPFGAVRVTNADALGATGSANRTRIYGNSNSGGRLELAGGITLPESIILYGRQTDQASKPAVWNFSGDNVMSGAFSLSAGGANYNFGSASGKLTIQANISWNNIGGDRWINWYGDGDGEFAGNLTGGGSHVSHYVLKHGAGKLTLSGSANSSMGNLVVFGGTLKIAATAGMGFAGPDSDVRIHTSANSTLDVSEVAGGYTVLQGQTLQGQGTVSGAINLADGSRVSPGGIATVDESTIRLSFDESAGQLSVTGDLNMSASGTGAEMVWQLAALSTAAPGIDFDQMVVGGNLALGGTSALTLNFDLLNGTGPGSGDPFWNSAHQWKIIDAASNLGDTNFAVVNNAAFGTGKFTTSVGTGPDAGDIYLNYAVGVPGDFDGDGDVDETDFGIWSNHFPATSGAGVGQGDADGDGDVDGADFIVWQTHFPSPQSVTTVPEPESAILLSYGVIGLALLGRAKLRGRLCSWAKCHRGGNAVGYAASGAEE